jgi:hypothetical protein
VVLALTGGLAAPAIAAVMSFAAADAQLLHAAPSHLVCTISGYRQYDSAGCQRALLVCDTRSCQLRTISVCALVQGLAAIGTTGAAVAATYVTSATIGVLFGASGAGLVVRTVEIRNSGRKNVYKTKSPRCQNSGTRLYVMVRLAIRAPASSSLSPSST